MSISRKTLIQRAFYDEFRDMIYGIASGGTSTTLIDNGSTNSNQMVLSSGDNAEKYIDASLAMTGGTSGNISLERKISTYTPGSYQLTVYDAFPSAVVSADTYEIHFSSTRREKVEALNRALRNRLFYTKLEPLTDVPDGGMEQTGITHWTGVNATPAKATSSGNVFFGAQSLSVTDSGSGGGYTKSDSLQVKAHVTYYLEALVRPTGTSIASITVWDETNNQAISITGGIATARAAATDGTRPEIVNGFVQIPSTCKSVHIRLVESVASQVAYWDDVFWFDPNERQRFLPYMSTVGDEVPAENQYRGLWTRYGKETYQWQLKKVPENEIFLNHLNVAGPYVLLGPGNLGTDPHYIEIVKFYSELTGLGSSAEAATTEAPELWLTYAAIVEFLLPRWRRTSDVNKKVVGGVLRKYLVQMMAEREKVMEKPHARLADIPVSVS